MKTRSSCQASLMPGGAISRHPDSRLLSESSEPKVAVESSHGKKRWTGDCLVADWLGPWLTNFENKVPLAPRASAKGNKRQSQEFGVWRFKTRWRNTGAAYTLCGTKAPPPSLSLSLGFFDWSATACQHSGTQGQMKANLNSEKHVRLTDSKGRFRFEQSVAINAALCSNPIEDQGQTAVENTESGESIDTGLNLDTCDETDKVSSTEVLSRPG
ncbi:hypothetical protein QBC34DRAFT_51688 [Podospora aff. communis PSN243]|uniref:Uncharacterized protein n=1 Tax=Podospora aff. communis PSN243 TaxID=3040156 RepID=A0AAV9GTV7_9PEZI|nr:hypothetical protein QBC34DRAFT_51688 [Podospora aff. communis PSN243]